MKPTSKPLGSFRKRFFPIYNHELPQILPLFMLFFLVTMNYGILRTMKEALITARGGSKLIAQVKLWAVVPILFFFKFVYDTLSRRVGSKGRVYGIICYFTSFFLLYWFVLRHYTSEEKITPEMKTWVALYKLWPSVLFYVHCEATGTFMLSVATWAFVNEITPRSLGERCYSTFSISTGFATFLAGSLGGYFSKEENQGILMGIIIGGNLLYVLIYFYFTRSIALYPERYNIAPKKAKKGKKKLGFVDSIKYLFTSNNASYIGLILCLVLAYSIGINLFEAVYKQWLYHVATVEGINKQEFMRQMTGLQLQLIGGASLITTLFLASFVNDRGWLTSAMFVPVAFLILGVAFFIALFFSHDDDIKSLRLAMYIGVMVVVCVKAFKYVFFDRSKELLYKGFPTVEEQVYTKSAVDGVAARVGKAGGSVIVQILTTWVYNFRILEIKEFFFFLIVLILIIWVFAVVRLSVRYEKMKDIADGESKKATNKPKATAEKVGQEVKSQ